MPNDIGPLLYGLLPLLSTPPQCGTCRYYDTNPLLQNVNLHQCMLDINNAEMQYRTRMMQLQQCCCNYDRVNTTSMMGMQNAITSINYPYIPPPPVVSEVREDLVYTLDKMLFPDNPIREYISSEIKKVKEKYKARLELLDSLI